MEKQKEFKNIFGMVMKVTKIPAERITKIDSELGLAFEVELHILEHSEIRGVPAMRPIRLKMEKSYEVGTKIYARISITKSDNGRSFTNLVTVIDETQPAQKK